MKYRFELVRAIEPNRALYDRRSLSLVPIERWCCRFLIQLRLQLTPARVDVLVQRADHCLPVTRFHRLEQTPVLRCRAARAPTDEVDEIERILRPQHLY